MRSTSSPSPASSSEPDEPSGVPGLRGGGERGLLTKLVHAGFRSRLRGAPLKRAIQQKVENPLAQALLSGRVIPGKTLRLGADSNGLTMTQ